MKAQLSPRKTGGRKVIRWMAFFSSSSRLPCAEGELKPSENRRFLLVLILGIIGMYIMPKGEREIELPQFKTRRTSDVKSHKFDQDYLCILVDLFPGQGTHIRFYPGEGRLEWMPRKMEMLAILDLWLE